MNAIMKNRLLIVSSLFGLLLVSCKTDDVPIEEATETKIQSSGGTALSAARELTLVFAPNAFPGETTVKITTDRKTSISGASGPIFEISTNPVRESFGAQVELRIENRKNDPVVLLANFDGPQPVVVAGQSYDPDTKVARGTLEHFSRYGLLVDTSTCPPTQREPSTGDSCSFDVDPQFECGYGESFCCGNIDPARVCTCDGTSWTCVTTEDCAIRFPNDCPDSGVPPEQPDLGEPDLGAEVMCQGTCEQRIRQCTLNAGVWSCPCPESTDPVYNAVVSCLNATGSGSLEGSLECQCFEPYSACANQSSTDLDAGYSSTFDGCGI